MTAVMSNSTEGKYNNIWLPVATSGIFTLAGLLVESFIVAVNVIDWLKGRLMKATDQIITSIGISRFFCLISSLLYMFSELYSTKFDIRFYLFIVCTWQTSDFSSIWLSTLLSIFFSFRISTFQNVFFLYLKAIISRRVVYLIFASVLLGFIYSFIGLVLHFILFRDSMDQEKPVQIMSALYFSCSLIPLLVYFVFSVLLVVFTCAD